MDERGSQRLTFRKCGMVPYFNCSRSNMNVTKLWLLVIGCCLAVLLWGCSVSSQPPVPLQVASATNLSSGTTNRAYIANLSASGGVPPYTWSVSSGNLPPGLVLSPAGSLSGTPTSAGAFSFTAQVTDLAHPQEVGNVVVSLTVIDPLLIQVNSLPNGSPGA